MANSVQHIGVGNQLKCAAQMVALQPAVNAWLHLYGTIGTKPHCFACVGCLPTQLILCVAYLKRCWYFLCKFAFCSLLINFVVSLNIRPVCQKAYSASSSCRHTFSDNKIISLFTKYFNKFRFQSDCPIHTPTSEVGEQSGIADLLIPFVRLFSLGQHGVITTLYKSKIWQHIFFLSLTGTTMTLTLKAETHNGQESPYLGILHLFHTWPLFCWSL